MNNGLRMFLVVGLAFIIGFLATTLVQFKNLYEREHQMVKELVYLDGVRESFLLKAGNFSVRMCNYIYFDAKNNSGNSTIPFEFAGFEGGNCMFNQDWALKVWTKWYEETNSFQHYKGFGYIHEFHAMNTGERLKELQDEIDEYWKVVNETVVTLSAPPTSGTVSSGEATNRGSN